jgi:PAS domain S-box-containing protein
MSSPAERLADGAAAAEPQRRPFLVHWLMLMLGLVLLGAQMIWSIIDSRERIEHEATSRLENHSLVLDGILARQLEATDAALAYMIRHGRRDLGRREDAQHLSAELGMLRNTLQGVRTLFMLDAQGVMVASSRPELIGRNFAGRDYFQALRDQSQPDRLHVSPAFVSILGAFTIGLSRPLFDSHGRFAGAVVATLDVDGMHELLTSLHPLAGTRLAVIHGDGTLLKLVPERDEAPPGRNIGERGFHLRQHLDSGKTVSLQRGISGMFGKEVIVAVRTVRPASLQMDGALVVAASRDIDDILAPWRETVRHYLVFFALITLGTTLALWLYQRRQRGFERELDSKEAESQHRLLTLQRFIDHLPGLAYVSDADGRTLMASRGFRTLLGMEPAGMIGKSNTELFPGTFGAKIDADNRAVLDSGNTMTVEEHFGGRDYETTKFVIADGGSRRQIGGITLDITARKEAERALADQMAELRELNRKLEEAHHQLLQSEKMASIGQLAAGVAHELNNPIGFVHSNLGTLEEYLHDIFQVADFCIAAEKEAIHCPQLQKIDALKQEKDYAFLRGDIVQLLAESRDGLARVTKIVKDLKDFSRPGEQAMQWADLHHGLESTLNIVRNEIKYKCDVKKEYGELPLVWCVPSQINQVFMNLLTNAGHAIPEKGTITLRTGRRGDEVFIAVNDTGDGIAPENLRHIFEPFFTTKPVGQGTGLGLALAYGIVQKHGGRIEVESEPGRGSTFTVWLPIQPHDSDSAEAAAALPSSPA